MGKALFEGLKHACFEMNSDLIVTLDCDGSHNPYVIPALVEKLDDVDMVIGSRYTQDGEIGEWPLHRRLLSSLGNLYLQVLLGMRHVTDYTSNFRAFHADAIKPLLLSNTLPTDWSFLCMFLVEAKRLELSVLHRKALPV